jgi:hypothetical protein
LGEVVSQSPAFIRSDAWLLAAIAEHHPSGTAQKLQEFAHDCDWLNRSIPTFDEVSFGLRRLAAESYVTFERETGRVLRLRATPKTTELAARITEQRKSPDGTLPSLSDHLSAFGSALGCQPYPRKEIEDRSLGRLPDFEQLEWQKAVAAYDAWFRDVTEGVDRPRP